MIIPPLRLDFRVLAQEVEAQCLHALQFVHHCFVRRRRVQSLHPVALIQQTVEQNRLTVQAEARNAVRIRLTRPLPHGKVAFHLVLRQRNFHIVEERIVWRPAVQRLFRQLQGNTRLMMNRRVPRQGDFPAVCGHAKGHKAVGTDRDGKTNRARRHVRRNRQLLHIAVRHAFQPDGLPNAALRGIEHAAGGQFLLAARLNAAVGRILHGDMQRIFAVPQIVGDIQRKRPVAAAVPPDLPMIDENHAVIVHRAEMQQHAPAIPIRRRKHAPIVQPLIRLKRPPNARSCRLRRIRHEDFAVPRMGQGFIRRNGVRPRTIEIQKAVSAQRRTRIFRERNHERLPFRLFMTIVAHPPEK